MKRTDCNGKLVTVKKSSAKERKEAISNGCWMPRRAVFDTGRQKANSRASLKKILRKEVEAVGF